MFTNWDKILRTVIHAEEIETPLAQFAARPARAMLPAQINGRGLAMRDGTAVYEALAEAAGLRLAWERHRADVEEAIRGTAALRGGFTRPTDPAAEPSPPYAVPSARREAGR